MLEFSRVYFELGMRECPFGSHFSHAFALCIVWVPIADSIALEECIYHYFI